VEVTQAKNPRFALEFQLTQIAQKFMKDNWPRRTMGISLPSTTEKNERAKVINYYIIYLIYLIVIIIIILM
jgi:hypothetical protein